MSPTNHDKMSDVKKENKATKFITPKCRLSYVHVFEPTTAPGSTVAKFSVSIIIPKSDKKAIAAIKACIEAAKADGLAKTFGGKFPANGKVPLRDGDTERPEDPTYANSYFINASSRTKPGIVDALLQPITDATELYSGAYGKVSLNFYPFNTNGNKGIACGLNNIQKIADGEALGGRSRAEDDFSVEDTGETDDEDLLG